MKKILQPKMLHQSRQVVLRVTDLLICHSLYPSLSFSFLLDL